MRGKESKLTIDEIRNKMTSIEQIELEKMEEEA